MFYSLKAQADYENAKNVRKMQKLATDDLNNLLVYLKD
nr:MAG TPA: hypothetical protein [Caudoviricetes sp.]